MAHLLLRRHTKPTLRQNQKSHFFASTPKIGVFDCLLKMKNINGN